MYVTEQRIIINGNLKPVAMTMQLHFSYKYIYF